MARGAEGCQRVLRIEVAEGTGGRIFPPAGRRGAEALDPSAFLVDEHRRIPAANGFAEGRCEGLDLGGGFAVALEENEAPGILFAEEGGFSRRQLRGFAPADEAAHFHDAGCGLLLADKTVAFTGGHQRTADLCRLIARGHGAYGEAVAGAAADGGGIDGRWQGSDNA